MAYEDVFRSIKIKSKIGLPKGVTIKRFDIPLSLEEHEVENRISKVEKFNQPPGLVADRTNAAEATREVVNRDFLLAGNNMTSALCTPEDNGGILLTPDGGNTDGCLIKPHATKISSWTDVKWNSGKKLRFSTRIRTGASITKFQVAAGFKLTDTTVPATDDDQVFFSKTYDETTWQLISSNDGTDTKVNSGVTIAANSDYELIIEVGADRVPKFYINDAYVGKTAALKANTDYIPVIATLSSTGASTTKTLAIRYLACSRDY